MPTIRLSVRELVEFLLRTGSIDSRFTGFDRANEGARIHRRLQKAAGEGYAAEVFLTAERTMEGIGFTIEGRADGIFTDEDGTVVIDEIKTTAAPTDAITEDMNPCHWAQGMVYGAICAEQRELETLDVRLTYYQIATDEIIRYPRPFSAAELDAFLNDLLRQYLPWARRQLDWVEARDRSLGALQFPFPAYRPGQRALAGEVYRACAAGKAEQKGGTRLFCQAPTGIGKTMSALFPALKAMGEGKGEKIFYLTARNTTQAAAEDALARLRAADPALSLRSVTLSAKEKACLCKDAEGRPACLPEACPYANGYYERLKDALADLLDSAVPYDRAALTETARRHRVCPFELGLDLSEWCDVVIGDYNYLFDGGRLHFSHRRGPQPAGPGQSHVLGTVLQEQPDRCQTGHRQRKKRTENCVDKGRQGLSGSTPGGNEARPPPGFSTHRIADRGSHPTDQPSGHRTGRSRLPAAGAFAGAGWHGLFARTAEGAAPTAV